MHILYSSLLQTSWKLSINFTHNLHKSEDRTQNEKKIWQLFLISDYKMHIVRTENTEINKISLNSYLWMSSGIYQHLMCDKTQQALISW
jgi:hypothetical protein